MRATVYVRLKSEVLDPQGDAVRRALEKLGFDGVRNVRVGKLVELELDGQDEAAAKSKLEKISDEMLANPVIEDFEIKIG
jgi:phosphoribosylformylglycinamidine synthase PurS subunit